MVWQAVAWRLEQTEVVAQFEAFLKSFEDMSSAYVRDFRTDYKPFEDIGFANAPSSHKMYNEVS